MKEHNEFGAEGGRAARGSGGGFTLIELLVVIAIIAILAALLMPTIGRMKLQAQKKQAELDCRKIANAIHTYESEYSKFPVSSVGAVTATSEAARLKEDFTYGTKGVICVGPGGPNAVDAGFSTPGGGLYPIVTEDSNYQTNNAEVMSVLMDVESWPDSPTQPTINKGHVKNPQKTQFLNAKMAGDKVSPGIGQDGVFRDLWGNPHLITMDMNFDDKTCDAFHHPDTVSADPKDANTPKRGLNGLIPTAHGTATHYEANAPVMVWSAGPDKMIDPNSKATAGVNKDNIVSWK